MSLTPMDFSGEIKPLTAGTYAARIIAGEGTVSKAGNPMINWQFETFGSPEVSGKRIFYTTMTSGGWVSKLADLHKAATGEPIDKTAKQYDPQMLVSREVTVTVVNKDYQKNDGSAGTRIEVVSVAPYKQ